MILVTGFEPFAGASLNPSGEIAKRIELDGVITAVLPVSYDRATEKLRELIAAHKPSTVICLGQAEGRASISLEQVAINLDDTALADNDGVTRIAEPITQSGPDAFFTTLPIRELANKINEQGIAATVSLSAGAFVCNHIFYELQKSLEGLGLRSGFIHVPLMAEQAAEFAGKPTMPIELQVKAVETVIRELG
jgi:pyroglutamyl-peptidase